jgi:hypothetical protein
MRNLSVTTLLLLCLSAPIRAQQPLDIRSISDSVIVLSDGRSWQPGLHLIRHIYTLQQAGGVPFFVLLGVGCTECDALYEIHILRPGQTQDSAHAGFAAPGRDYEMGEDSANAFRRQFFGRCIEPNVDAAVQFAHEEGRDSVWVDSIRTVVVTRDSVIVRNYAHTDSLERQVHSLVASGSCREWQVR